MRSEELGSLKLLEHVEVDPETGCWNWKHAKDRYGRAIVNMGGKVRNAARVVWEQSKGLIPEGMCICHTCDNRSCVNPDHLWLGTVADNQADMQRKGRNRQPKGEAVGTAKLTEKQVREILKKYDEGLVTQTALAKEYGVNDVTINYIVRRINWTHIRMRRPRGRKSKSPKGKGGESV